jgi:PQQ-like domain
MVVRSIFAVLLATGCTVIAACGSGSTSTTFTRARAGVPPTASASAQTVSADPVRRTHEATAAPELLQWPEFGLDPQRSDATEDATGITSANIGRLHRLHLTLPGTVDSSPIYLHSAQVDGAIHETIVITTTYGKTLALGANSGRVLWTFTPPGYQSWAGTAQIIVTSPLADPDGGYVYAASPNGLIHKLSLADGREDREGAWPVRVTLEPKHEKLGAALNIDGPDLLVATSGYLGDIPPYQGHVVAIDRASGRIEAIFNTLCANRRSLQVPSSCPASDSAILSRGGAVVEPGGGRILIDTGNGPWNGATDFGDSVLELTFPGLGLRQSYTPTDQEHLNTSDLDLGSSAPALLGSKRVLVGGKDGILRVLDLARLNGRSVQTHTLLGGEVQQLPLPGGGELFTAPAVWQRAGHTTVFIGDEHATAAYALRGGRLHELWQNETPGTSPVLAGGLLYVYDPAEGGIYVYKSDSSRAAAKLPGLPGHWNSPIVVDGHVIEPEGNANEHLLSGTLDIFTAG